LAPKYVRPNEVIRECWQPSCDKVYVEAFSVVGAIELSSRTNLVFPVPALLSCVFPATKEARTTLLPPPPKL
jgi:hypothetical protein